METFPDWVSFSQQSVVQTRHVVSVQCCAAEGDVNKGHLFTPLRFASTSPSPDLHLAPVGHGGITPLLFLIFSSFILAEIRCQLN